MAKLTFAGISKFYKGAPALDGIDAEIASGEFVALLGPSGCGKSTLLRMTAGFERPDQGRISLGERLLSDAGAPRAFVPPEERNIGIVFQSYALWPHMSVAKNISYPLELRKVPAAESRKRLEEALALAGLSHLADRMPAELSGGQRQRVALARCLVAEPQAVLLDEPLANLDLTLRASMQEAFAAFHRRTNATMVYVTHDQSEAMAMADRVAVMKDGRIRQFAAPQALYTRPCDSFVAGFVGDGAVISIEAAGHLNASRQMVRALGCDFIVQSASARPSHLCIRPEQIAITPDGPIRAQVRSCTYLGGRFRLTLDSPAETLIAYSAHAVAVGTTVGLTIRDAWAFSDGPAALALKEDAYA